MRGLAGKVAVVAGAGGIGGAVSERLAAEGTVVVVADLNVDEARRVASEIQAREGIAVAEELDIADADSVEALFARTSRQFGRLDFLHANAADLSAQTYGADVDLVGAPLEVFDRTIAVNLRGYLLCTRAAIPIMLRHGGGAIVYTSSLAAFVGNQRAFYSMSKAALASMARSVAHGWGSRGIRANVIAPGFVPTKAALAVAAAGASGGNPQATLTPRATAPSDVADAVAYLFSAEAPLTQGQVIHLNGCVYMP